MNDYFNNNDEPEYIETSSYGNYYRPRPKQKDNGKYMALLFLIFIAITVLWRGGFLSTVDGEEEYIKLIDMVCDGSIEYVSNPVYRAAIPSISIPGRVVYIIVNELLEAGIVEGPLKDTRTGEKIANSTDIRLEVLSKDEVMCSGFAFPEDDRIIPEVFLIGSDVIYISKGEKVIDPGAYATDNRDGNISHKINITGNVNSAVPGEYYINYVAKDRAGNLSEKITRTIIVR